MTPTIRKWGSSLVVLLPEQLAENSQLGEGKEVEFEQTEEGVLLKAKAKVRYQLDELLAGMTDEKLHPETDWGPPRGKEAW